MRLMPSCAHRRKHGLLFIRPASHDASTRPSYAAPQRIVPPFLSYSVAAIAALAVLSSVEPSTTITIAEITPCVARATSSDDSASRTLVQWTNDGGADWNDLTTVPTAASPVEQPGNHPAVLTVRFRARTAADSCAMRV